MSANVHTASLLAYGFLILFHASLAPIMFDEISHRLVWYLGTDFGAVGFVAINVAARRAFSGDRVVWRMCHGFNAGFIGFNVLNLYAVPQTVNVAVLLIVVSIGITAWMIDVSRRTAASQAAAGGESLRSTPDVDS